MLFAKTINYKATLKHLKLYYLPKAGPRCKPTHEKKICKIKNYDHNYETNYAPLIINYKSKQYTYYMQYAYNTYNMQYAYNTY